MKLEQNEKSYLFSSTEIPDVFFSEYLSEATGDYIKVYLYMLFLSKYKKDIKITDISKKLALSFNTIQEAINYWEKHGVILKKASGFILCDLQEKELQALYKPRLVSSPEKLAEMENNKSRAKAIDAINTMFFQGIMPPSWYLDIDLWFKKYSFDEEVMVALFQHCYEKSALHKNYIQVVADAWNKSNIKTFSDLEMYSQKREKLNSFKKNISKKLGLNRSLTQFEEAYVETWVIDFGFSQEIIDIALKRTTSKANPNFDYLNKLLKDWHERGFKSTSEIQDFIKQSFDKDKFIKTYDKKPSKQSFDQRNYDNLDSLYANNKKT